MRREYYETFAAYTYDTIIMYEPESILSTVDQIIMFSHIARVIYVTCHHIWLVHMHRMIIKKLLSSKQLPQRT